MMDTERLEEYTLTNEELQRQIIKLSAQIDNLTVQISEYREIVADLSSRLKDFSDKM